MKIDVQPAPQQAPNLLFDWQLDVQRLEREAKAAATAGRGDPWALAEAECSLDLIDAELVALRGRDPNDAGDSVVQLRSWKSRLERVIRTLSALDPDRMRPASLGTGLGA